MRIITWNINGYRSAEKNGYFTSLINTYKPDVLCIQELKMNEAILAPDGYYAFYNFASKKGYSGTVIFTRKDPSRVRTVLGLNRFDEEGRFVLLEYDNYVIVDIYIPHGGRAKEQHPYKFEVLDIFLHFLKGVSKPVFVGTDMNIAHTELDVKNYRTNYNNNMFSPKERGYIDALLKLGLVDSFRVLHKEGDVYSMWPNGFDARARNMGWRIDYIFVTDSLATRILRAEYLKDHFGSDHCPYLIDIEL